MSRKHRQLYKFGKFTFSPEEGLLLCDGKLVPLPPKPAEILRFYIESNQKVVSAADLKRYVWKNEHIHDNNPYQQVSLLRKLLSEADPEHNYIETIPKRGYRFAAEVQSVIEPLEEGNPGRGRQVAPAQADGVQRSASDTSASGAGIANAAVATRASRRPIVLAVALVAGVVLAASALLLLGRRNTGDLPPHSALSIEPLRNLSANDEDSWMSAAIAEMFRTELTHSGMAVAVRSNEANSGDDGVREVSGPASSDFSLSGSYVRLRSSSGDQIRLDLRLARASSGESIGTVSDSGPAQDLFRIVSHAAAQLREKLGVGQISPDDLAKLRRSWPANIEAARLLAQGREELRMLSGRGAIAVLEKAVDADPDSAMIQSTLAEAWSIFGNDAKAREWAAKSIANVESLSRLAALEIEGRDAAVHGKWQEAVRTYDALWQVSPGDHEFGLNLADAQLSVGQTDRAVETISELKRINGPEGDLRIALVEARALEASGDFRAEYELATETARRARATGAKAIEAWAQLRAVWALNNLGQRDQALDLANEARQAFAEISDLRGEAAALKNTADVIDDGGRHRDSIPIYDEAAAKFREAGDRAGLAVSLNNVSYAYKSLGDLETALGKLEESLAISRQIEDEARVAQALNGIASIHWRQGRLEPARELYEEAVRIHQNRGDKSRAGRVLNNLALVLQDEGRLPDARQRFEEALVLYRATSDQTNIARTLGNLGDLLVLQGDLKEANDKYEEALRLSKSLEDDWQKSYALQGLGLVSRERDELAAAQSHLLEAIRLRDHMEAWGVAAEARLLLAEVALDSDDPKLAAENARRAYDEFRKEEEASLACWAALVWARAARSNQGSEELDNALAFAIENLDKINERAIKLNVFTHRAVLLAEHGDSPQALSILNGVLADTDRYGFYGLNLRAALVLSTIERRMDKEEGRRRASELRDEASIRGYILISDRAAALAGR